MREERNMFISPVQVFSELRPELRLHLPPRSPPHLFPASPPATHFILINDPMSPTTTTTRLCFYRLLFNVDLGRPVVTAASNWSRCVGPLMLMVNSVVASCTRNSPLNAAACESMCAGVRWYAIKVHTFAVETISTLFGLCWGLLIESLKLQGFFFPVFHLQPNQISMDENILVSRYINNPLLIDGKFFFAYFIISHPAQFFGHTVLIIASFCFCLQISSSMCASTCW